MAARRGCGGAGASGRGPPPVLILSHFCPRPFVCFGDLRPGASRTLPLAVLNPNAEAAAVTLPRGPAADRGFRVCPRAFELQPKEKVVISVNWTPVKEGRVREILTFLVNDILKHEVILLGNAEEPRKKKRSLWDTIKKKKVSSSSSHKKRISNIQNVNQTFSVPPKADRVRSPLQACENLGGNEGCSPTENNSLILQENKIPISPISPTFKECHGDTCLPLCVRRSTTYTSLHSPENGELWTLEGAHMRKEFNGKVVTETSFDSLAGINGQIEEDGKRSLTPNCSSTWNIIQSQGDFLSPDSFVKNSHRASNKLESVTVSPDTFLKDDSRPRHLESNTMHEIYQTILSPDSFLKDNYGLNQKLESESVNPFVSPNQFVRDNMPYLSLSQPTCELSPLSKGHSQAPPSPPGQRKDEVLLFIPGNQGANSPKAIFPEPEASEMIADGHGFTKQTQPAFPAAQDTAGQAHGAQPRRRPILSATVTKPKPAGPRERGLEPSEPKARRCLRSAVGDCGTAAGTAADDLEEEEEDALHPYLPVIDPEGGNPKGCRRAAPSCKAAFQARKRKSGGGGEDAAGASAGTGHAGERESKRTHFSPAESPTSTAKKTHVPVTPASQCRSSRGRPHPKKKADSLAFKTPNSKTHKRTPRMVPVAQASLTFIKRLKTDIPRHPMPFAAKNMFYDERWKEKQQQGLTWWLNFILTPDDFAVKTHVSEVNAASLLLGGESHHKLSVLRAPTKEEVSLRAYTARRRLNRLRHAACRLFTSESMVKAIKKLEVEITARRLAVRRDRHLWKDVGERQKVLNWLLSYNPLWLRIGLETVFGELIALEDNSDVTGLAVFILHRLLWNPDIAAEYRHPSVPHLYRDGHEEALSAFTLKKLLLLVCFLDRAKLSRLIDHDPCLFCKDAEFKASRDVLLAFSRSFLSGEGDLSRHLSWLGLPVSHVQTPLDEFDFAVTNLAVDLQCGVRLVRTMELLTRNWDLSKQLRIPAISRLQKMHNVELALQALRSRGVPLQDEQGGAILAKDIVDRHREKTLALLWKIALAFQVDISLNLDELKEEIEFLKRTWRVKRSMPARSRPADAVLSAKTDARPSDSSEQRPQSIRLLMEWVQAVCAFYSLRVENFTVSFSDGRVLCYLIHHYHPRCVPLDAIRQRTSQTVECAQSGSVVLNSSSESDESCLDLSLKALELAGKAPELHRELLENERRNFQLVSSAARDLGGIPAMVQHADMSNTIPDEKVVVTYLSFLCARLLDLRRETRAARHIQAAWREYKLRADLRRRQERDQAARIIQAAVLGFLTRRRLRKEAQAALAIQRRWRRLCRRRAVLRAEQVQLEKAQNLSASVIQRNWRRYSARKQFLRLRHYSVVLQSRRRMVAAVASYKRHLWAAVTIQRHWRACLRRKQDQQSYQALRASCLVIQSAFRRWRRREQRLQMRAVATLQRAFREWRARKRAREEKAATALQAWYRAHREVRRYRHVRACIVLIQARFRGFRARKLFQRKKASVLTIQQRWRAHLQGKAECARYLRARAAALRLQAAFRAARARGQRRQTRAACVLQAYWRMRRERARFLSLRQTVIRLQALVRKHQQLQNYRKMKSATLVIQVHFRAYVAARRARASYQETRAAVLVLQAACRGMRARRRFRLARTSVVKIQSRCRACIARRRFLSLKHAAVQLQSIVRMRQARARYLRLRAAALFTQRRFRALKTASRRREEYQRVRAACIRLQAFARGHLVRRQLRLQSSAAVTLQSCFRMRAARRHFLRVRSAALVIQRAYRARQARLSCRKRWQVLRAVTRLQAAYRGYRARQLLRHRSTAALKIQATFRGHRERVRFQSVLRSAVTIQRWYRACRTARDLRAQFFKARTAALSLQAACRGWKVRAQIRREQQAALKIQAAFRAAQARRQFRRLRTAALVLQRRWRARAAGRRQRVAYAGLRQAVLTLQAAWRARTARRQIQKRHECATIIQVQYRMHVQRRRWAALREAVCLIQARYRAHRLGREQRLWYLKTKEAVVTLQAAFRRMRARRERARERGRAAAVIQSRYRAHRARRRYSACRASAITIQRWYRRVRAARQQRGEYLHVKEAATHLQAAYRGLRARRQLQRMHRAATAIQAVFKMHQAQGRFHQVRAAAIVIQVRYRACCQGRAQRAQYLAVLQAARVLQASWRGARVRRTLRQMQTAAVLIQSCYRRYRQQTHFLQLKQATEAVQRRYRAAQAGRLQLQSYASLRRCVIRVQAAFRGRRARRRVRALHLAAAVIQRRFRALLARRRFLSLRSTAVWVQRRYRANVRAKHRRQLLRLREAAIKIQARVRGWLVRRRLREMHRAATVVQAALRMHRARARYQALKQASVLIQRRYRAGRAARLRREECVGQRGAAEVLPAAQEGAKAGQLSQEQHRAAAVIQSAYRRHRQRLSHQQLRVAPGVTQERHGANEEALDHRALAKAAAGTQAGSAAPAVGERRREQRLVAVSVQPHLRAVRRRKRFLQFRAAVAFVQRRRGMVTAARTPAAPGLQSSCRGLRGHRDGDHRLRATTCIQASRQVHRACATDRAESSAATVVQNHCGLYVRGTAGGRRCSAARRPAPPVEAACRGPRGRQALGEASEGAVAASAGPPATRCDGPGAQQDTAWSPAARPHSGAEAHSQGEAAVTRPPALRETAPGMLGAREPAALRVRPSLRTAVCRSRFVRRSRPAVTLPLSSRAQRARRRFLLGKDAVAVQNCRRACASARLQRRAWLHIRSSVVIIQAWTRGFLQKRKFQRIKASALTIQAAWRSYRARRRARAVEAACRIQAWFRGWKARKAFLAVLKAVRAVQGRFRARRARARFLSVRASAVSIQRRWRATLCGRRAREHFLAMQTSERRATVRLLHFAAAARCHLAAVRIQRAYRCHVAVRSAERHLDSVICIQRWFRARLRLRRFMQICHSVIDLQHEVQERRRRQHRAASVIQAAARRFLLHRKQERFRHGVVKIQALWRGYALRKKNNCTKIKAIRRSLQALSGEVREEDKLYKRTALALFHLLTYKHLSAVLEALKHLEVVTRLSPLCCENMAQSGAILKIFLLIRSCNRSVPCMEVVSYAVQVLLHVAKYEKTTAAVGAVDGCVDTLLDLLRMYREKPGDRIADKSGSIFTKTCCLLAVLLKAPSRASDVRSRSKVADCVYSIYKLTAHKHRVDAERMLHKQSQNCSVSLPRLPETPARARMVARLQPGWVLRRDNVQEITAPLQAVQLVMDTLGVPYP